ncbi:MAG TPA: hypothetical protein VGJ00_04095 [Rhabdochlamydiaceae bacterium]|jgi:hypothetical protein
MSIADVTESNILKLIFNATTWANVAINATASPITQIAVALHTADPGDAGTQSTSEATYTSYARVNVNRDTGGWTVSGTNPTVCSPVAAITFPAGTGGSGTVTHFSVGKTGGGASDIYWSGTVTPNIVTGNGVTPQLTTASTIALD